MPKKPKALGLSELIARVKHDLLLESEPKSPKLFIIDEITLELSFVVKADINGGFDLQVVTLGSEVAEERVQKVTVKLTPIVSRQQLIQLINQNPQAAEATIRDSLGAIVHGDKPGDDPIKDILGRIKRGSLPLRGGGSFGKLGGGDLGGTGQEGGGHLGGFGDLGGGGGD